MSKIETLERDNKKLAEENQNLRNAKSKLERLNKLLAEKNKSLLKQLNGSAMHNGVSHGVANDVAREFNSSNLAKTRPPESQFNELNPEDLSEFMETYCEIEKQLGLLKVTCKEQSQFIKSKKEEIDKLKTINATLLAEKVELEAENKRNEKGKFNLYR